MMMSLRTSPGPFCDPGNPVTFAILPAGKTFQTTLQKSEVLNFPVMLHLPMEPIDLP